MATYETLFVTPLYRAMLGPRLNPALTKAATFLAAEDRAGRQWSRTHDYKGYTSYASLNDLPRRIPAFADLTALLEIHVAAFARRAGFDLAFDRGRRKLELDSLWVNVMRAGAVHTPHIHPQAVVSGTYYVRAPKGAGAIRFEDPRLALMMAAPPKKKNAPLACRSFVEVAPRAGMLLLWESWLRHGVEAGTAPRISVSFIGGDVSAGSGAGYPPTVPQGATHDIRGPRRGEPP